MKTKKYTKITRKRLKECLNLIGWDIKHRGTNHYCILNQYKNTTDFIFSSDDENSEIYSIWYNGKFGKGQKFSNGGDCVFVLDNCNLQLFGENKKYTCVSIGVNIKNFNPPAFLQFYNH
jgi:hypothetical protein